MSQWQTIPDYVRCPICQCARRLVFEFHDSDGRGEGWHCTKCGAGTTTNRNDLAAEHPAVQP